MPVLAGNRLDEHTVISFDVRGGLLGRMVFVRLGHAEGPVTFCAGDFSAGVPLGDADFLPAVWAVEGDERMFAMVGRWRAVGDVNRLLTFRAPGVFAGVCFRDTEAVSAMAAPKINHGLSRFPSDLLCGCHPAVVVLDRPPIYPFIVSGRADGSKCFLMYFFLVFAARGI
jgi:hypothetical protein